MSPVDLHRRLITGFSYGFSLAQNHSDTHPHSFPSSVNLACLVMPVFVAMCLLHSLCCGPMPTCPVWTCDLTKGCHFMLLFCFFFTGAMKSKTSLAVSLGWGKFSPLRSSQDCQLSLTKHDVFLHLPTLLLVYHSWNGFLFSRERRWHNCIDVSVDSYLPKKNHQETRGSVRAKSQLPPSSSMSLALSQDYFCFATP